MVQISFEHPSKISNFPKLQGCGLKNEPVVLILKFQGPKLKRAWQAQFLSHTLVILEYEGFFIDVEMILVTFFYISIV